MKVECSVEKLKNILPLIDRITGKNLTLQILSCILVVANGKTIKLRATNLDLGIEVEIPAKIEKEGVVAVKGSTLQEFISTINKEKSIIFEEKNGNLKITSSQNIATLKCYPPTDFPTIPIVSQNNQFLIEPRKLINGIQNVFYSASLSDIKPEIAGVYIYPLNDELVFVATDSFRLSEKRIKSKKLPDFSGVIIPLKNINEIIRALEIAEEDVKVCFTKNQISFFFGGVYLTSRLIDGVFPDYQQIIPKGENTTVVVLKQDFLQGLKMNNIFLDKFNQLTILINPKGKLFKITSKSGEIGEVEANISASLEGDAVEAHFNYRYLFDALQSINEDSLILSFTSNQKPLTITEVGDKSFRYLIMPLNR